MQSTSFKSGSQTLTPERKVFGGCARSVLGQAVARMDEKGITPVCAFELEFHLFKPNGEAGDPFQVASSDDTPDAQLMLRPDVLAEKAPVFRDIRNAASWADLPVDTIVKEPGRDNLRSISITVIMRCGRRTM